MNKIDPTVIIRGEVDLGEGNELLPYTVLYGPLKVGNDNVIGPQVAIGTPGQDTRNPRYDSSECRVEIGDGNIIREFTAVQKPCYQDLTRIGNRCFLMQSVHVPHDAILENGVVITPMVAMGGIVRIMEGATLAIGCSIHQHGVVGAYSIVGMGASATKNVKPFSRFVPGKPISVNHYAVKKHGFAELESEITSYVIEGLKPKSSIVGEIVERFEAAHRDSKRELYE